MTTRARYWRERARVSFMGVRYRVPEVTETRRMVLPVNIGAVISSVAHMRGVGVFKDASGSSGWSELLV